jgi:ADP-ribose pyrophosphatase
MFKNAPHGWAIKLVKHIYSNDLIKDTLDLDEEKIYTRALRRNYSTIVPFISNDRILVIRSYRHLVDSIQVEAPSGYIEDGESPEQTARVSLKRKQVIQPKRL